MNRDDAIARLRAAEPDLKARGVTHAALFGSRARDDARPDSDTNIMVDIAPAAPVTIYDFVAPKHDVTTLLDGPVDVVKRDGLRSSARSSATADAGYGF
jgi:predicted nucleotidyltransferase